MFEFETNAFDNGYFDRPSQAFLLNRAINLFNQSYWGGLLHKAWSLLFRCNRSLFDLEIVPLNQVLSRRYGGIKPVNIDRICGSLSRTSDFDNQFHPLDERIRDRWVNIALVRSQDIPLAPVELVQVGDCYFVKDGHHRISVARALGENAIDAEITIWNICYPLPQGKQASSVSLPQAI